MSPKYVETPFILFNLSSIFTRSVFMSNSMCMDEKSPQLLLQLLGVRHVRWFSCRCPNSAVPIDDDAIVPQHACIALAFTLVCFGVRGSTGQCGARLVLKSCFCLSVHCLVSVWLQYACVVWMVVWIVVWIRADDTQLMLTHSQFDRYMVIASKRGLDKTLALLAQPSMPVTLLEHSRR
jgi:hypothetical protein